MVLLKVRINSSGSGAVVGAEVANSQGPLVRVMDRGFGFKAPSNGDIEGGDTKGFEEGGKEESGVGHDDLVPVHDGWVPASEFSKVIRVFDKDVERF